MLGDSGCSCWTSKYLYILILLEIFIIFQNEAFFTNYNYNITSYWLNNVQSPRPVWHAGCPYYRIWMSADFKYHSILLFEDVQSLRKSSPKNGSYASQCHHADQRIRARWNYMLKALQCVQDIWGIEDIHIFKQSGIILLLVILLTRSIDQIWDFFFFPKLVKNYVKWTEMTVIARKSGWKWYI